MEDFSISIPEIFSKVSEADLANELEKCLSNFVENILKSIASADPKQTLYNDPVNTPPGIHWGIQTIIRKRRNAYSKGSIILEIEIRKKGKPIDLD